jgi:hypothetical protein
LDARIIKFAALPDHDWTGADQENFLELVIPRHLRARMINEISRTSRANPDNVVLSGAKELAQVEKFTHRKLCNSSFGCEVPRRLRGSE